MTLKEMCPILRFGDLGDERGKLVVIESAQAIPFDVKRVFYIYDSDSTVVRGQHANRESEFVLINVAGKSKVRITDGAEELIVELNKPMMGVYIPKMIWKDMYDFSSDSVLLVLASTHYDGNEYIRDYDEYLKEMGKRATDSEPLVSLCMPTNGVTEWVFPVLDSIYSQNVDNSLFEVIITDNGKNAEFKQKMREYLPAHTNIVYAETEALPFINEIEAYKRASGKLLKFVNHRTLLVRGFLNQLIHFVTDNEKEKPIVYFANGVLDIERKQHVYKSFDWFVKRLSYLSSWSTGMAIWKDDLEEFSKTVDGFNELFPHTTILFHERNRGKYIIDNSIIFEELPQKKKPKGNYDLFFAFGIEYPGIINDLLREKSITSDTYRNVIDDNLTFVSELYLDYILRKRYCSYDLSGLYGMYNVYYSKRQVKQRVAKVIGIKARRKLIRRSAKLHMHCERSREEGYGQETR